MPLLVGFAESHVVENMCAQAALCNNDASATATCEKSRPKQGEGKDEASDTYK